MRVWQFEKEKSSGLTFTFQGDGEVDALSVAKALEGLVELATEISETNYPGVELRLTVKAIRPGSLVFDFVAAANILQNLLSPQNIQYAKNVVDTLKTTFEIKKHLGGMAPKKVSKEQDSILIENADGSQITVPTGAGVYFINSKIDRSVSSVIEGAMRSPGVTGLSFKDTDGNSFVIAESDFKTCSQEIALPLETGGRAEKVFTRNNEVLYVRRPDLLGGYQWGFKTVDKTIMAEVEDTEFLERIQSGKQAIVAKMYIIADLKVRVEIGEDGMPDESKCHYTVTKVHSVHTPDENQLSLL